MSLLVHSHSMCQYPLSPPSSDIPSLAMLAVIFLWQESRYKLPLCPVSKLWCAHLLLPANFLTVDSLSLLSSGGVEWHSWIKLWMATMVFFTPSNGSLFLFSTYHEVVFSGNISQSSLKWSRLASHCMRQCLATDFFPSAMAWNAKSPVTMTLVIMCG